jgi:hypothetical protein
MKKFILSAVAVGAMAIGSVAQADIIDGIGNAISQIFGVPYDSRPAVGAPTVSVYTDAYGRRFQVDASGRHVPLDRYGSYRDQFGRTVYLGANNQPVLIEQNGQVIPYASVAGNVAMAPSYDQDGDGVTNAYDRFPRDSRYQ